MEELLSFEVRPVQGVVVAVGEEVTFKEEDGKLLALNEGGEAFGVVPNKFSKKLLELTAAGEVISASVEGRSDGVPLIVVSREDETVEEDLDKELISVETTEKPSSEEDASQVAEAEETVQVSSTPIPPEEADKQAAASSKAFEKQNEANVTVQSQDVTQPSEQKDESGQGSKKKSKYVLIGILVAAAVVLVICIVAFSANGTQTVTDGTISLEVPADWTVEENSDDGYFDIASEDETIHMMLATYALTDYFTETELSSVSYLASAYGESEVADIFAIALIDALGDASVSVDESSYESSTTDDEVYLYTFEASFYDDEDVEYTGSFELILTGEYASFIAAFNSPDASDDDIVSMEEALESVTILNPSKPIFLDAEEDGEDDDTEDAEEEEEEETQTVSDGTLSIEIPADWEIVDSDSDTIVVRTASGEVIVDFVSAALDGSYSADAIASGVIEGATSDGTMTIDEDSLEEETTDDGVLIRSYDASLSYDGYEYEGTVVMFFSGDSYSVLSGLCLTDLLDEYGDELDEVMTSATVLDPSEPNLLSTTADEDIDEEEETDIESEEVEAEEEEETSEEETAEKLSLEIIDSGYYVTEDGDVYFGICVYNPNATYEIDSPKLTITGKDADGVITFTYTTYLDSLLPNEVQYVGDYVFGEAGTVTVEFSVPVLSDYKYEVSAETSVDCFTLSNINYVEGSYHDSITGEITTDIQLDDVTEARISVIFYDEDGNIVGGDYTYTDIAVEGSTMAFEISLDDELPDYATYEIYAYPQR